MVDESWDWISTVNFQEIQEHEMKIYSELVSPEILVHHADKLCVRVCVCAYTCEHSLMPWCVCL